MRDLPFIHRFHRPEQPNSHVIMTLHGTGGNESDLFPLAAQLDRGATLLGVRGRSIEEGITRFFRRFDLTRFDQADIRAEAEAFSVFFEGAVRAYDLDPGNITVLGYSNGANFAAAVMGLYPDLIRRAVLLRPLMPLDAPPEADLTKLRLLTLTGTDDPFRRFAASLNKWARSNGADLDAREIAAGHELVQEDLSIARVWLEAAQQKGDQQ